MPSDMYLSAVWTDLEDPAQKALLTYCSVMCDERGHVMLDIREAAAGISLGTAATMIALGELLKLGLMEAYEQGVSLDGRIWGYRLSRERMRELARKPLSTVYFDGYEEVAP